MRADLSRVEIRHFLKKLLPPFFRRRDLTPPQNFMSPPRGAEQKSESNQARSGLLARDATMFMAST
jgi:hypothetical protein